MFNEVQGLLQRVTTGEIDQSSVSQAADEHVSQMDPAQVQQHLQTAAENANQKGQGDVAQQIMGILQRGSSDPNTLKQEAISLIKSNPQILEHFAPEFARPLLSRLGG